jgi:hypothetical protein
LARRPAGSVSLRMPAGRQRSLNSSILHENTLFEQGRSTECSPAPIGCNPHLPRRR